MGRAPSPPEGISTEDALAKAVRILEQISIVAERLGVKIGLEAHDAFSAASTVARVLALVPSPHLGIVWDMLHTHRMGETPGHVWEVIGPRIFNLHVRDARRVPDGEGWQLVLLGEGEVPAREASMCSGAAGYEAGWSWSGKALARQPSCWGRSLLFGHEGAGWLRLSARASAALRQAAPV
ncbi:MAG TPA: TIM barrel protein [Candidatus Dormibacteraeota bacterium]|nr:TIM barrel protein [Candidatus Dormibacteraeota bacterium]